MDPEKEKLGDHRQYFCTVCSNTGLKSSTENSTGQIDVLAVQSMKIDKSGGPNEI